MQAHTVRMQPHEDGDKGQGCNCTPRTAGVLETRQTRESLRRAHGSATFDVDFQPQDCESTPMLF